MTSARPCCSRVIGKGRSNPFSERRRPLISVSMSLPRTTSESLTVSGVNRMMAAPARARLIPGAEVWSRRRRRFDVFCGRIPTRKTPAGTSKSWIGGSSNSEVQAAAVVVEAMVEARAVTISR